MPVQEVVPGGGPQGALAGLVQGYMGEQANMKHEEMLNQVSQHSNMVSYLQALVSNNDVPAEHKQWAMGKLGELAQWAPGKKLPKVDLSSLPAANIQQPDRQAVSQAPAMQLGGTQLTPPVGPGGVTATPTATPATAPAPSSEVGRSSNGTVNAMGSVQPPVAPGLTTATASKIIPPVAPGDMGPANVPGSIVTGFDKNGRPTLAPNSPQFDLVPPSPVTIPPSAATVIRNPQAPIPISPAGQIHLLTPEEHAMSQQAHIAAAINAAQQQDPSLTRDQAAWRLFHPGEPEPLMEVPVQGTVINKLTGREVAYGQDRTTAAGAKTKGIQPKFEGLTPISYYDPATNTNYSAFDKESMPPDVRKFADGTEEQLQKEADRKQAISDAKDRETERRAEKAAENRQQSAAERAAYGPAIDGAKKAKPMVDILDTQSEYMTGLQHGAKASPRKDLALIIAAVRAMNPGTVRLPNTELEMEVKAGSYKDRLGRTIKINAEGILPDDQRLDLFHVVRDETTRTATSARQEWDQAFAARHIPAPSYLQKFGEAPAATGGTVQPIAPVRTGPGAQTAPQGAPQNDNGVTFYPSSPPK